MAHDLAFLWCADILQHNPQWLCYRAEYFAVQYGYNIIKLGWTDNWIQSYQGLSECFTTFNLVGVESGICMDIKHIFDIIPTKDVGMNLTYP